MSIEIIKPGMLTTFQDLGRQQYQSLGIPVAGALDVNAHRVANLLVGNNVNEATLEVTVIGPKIKFNKPCCIAVSGADLTPAVNGYAVSMNRPLVIRPGDILSFGERSHGARAYIAIHGGFALKPVLGSMSTYLRSAIGGLDGRALRPGDEVQFKKFLDEVDLENLALDLWAIKYCMPASLVKSNRSELRIIKSAQWEDFSTESRVNILTESFKVTPVSDRMGYRLEGPQLKLKAPRQMISESVLFGTIQVPVGGQAIILMADRQTTGGYPKIAYVASIDHPLLAQMMPGDRFTFKLIEIGDAQSLDYKREQDFVALSKQTGQFKKLLDEASRLGHESQVGIESESLMELAGI